MRRHFLFPEDEHENGVGDGSANLLRLWLDRRAQILCQEPIVRYIALFWDLAKAKQDARLSATRYNEFFARVAKALLQSVNNDSATAISHRDWLYDTEGAARDGQMTLELFREAVMQVAELILPVESDESMYVSFFLELRECIAMADGHLLPTDSNDNDGGGGPAIDDDNDGNKPLRASPSTPQLYEALAFVLRPLKDVTKIRGAFLQKIPPGHEQLKAVSGLTPPNSTQMSLKQLLLCYNPRKFTLSRKFSALFADNSSPSTSTNNNSSSTTEEDDDDGAADQATSDSSSSYACRAVLAAVSAPMSSQILNKVSDDDWDDEVAAIKSLEQFPAFRVAIVGPPHCGKTRVAKLLADKLTLKYISIGTALEEAIHRKKARRHEAAARASAKVAANEELQVSAAGAATESESAQASESTEPTEGASAVESTLGEPTNKTLPDEIEPTQSVAAELEPVHIEDAIFLDADFDALFAGETLARSKCLKIFIYYVKKSLLEGVGVVMDDVHPDEIEHEIDTDYLVVLSATRDDTEQQTQQFKIAPTTRRVYSARERAILTGDAASIEALGFADFVQVRAETAPETGGGDEANSTDKLKAAESSDDAQSPDADNEGEADAAPVAEGDEGGDGEQEGPPLPVEPSQAERNWIEAPDEPTLSIRSLLMESFRDRYRDFVSRIEKRLAAMDIESIKSQTLRYHVIHVLASQSHCVILDHCVRAITGVSLSIGSFVGGCFSSDVAVRVLLRCRIRLGSRAPTSRDEWFQCRYQKSLQRLHQTAEQTRSAGFYTVTGVKWAKRAATLSRRESFGPYYPSESDGCRGGKSSVP